MIIAYLVSFQKSKKCLLQRVVIKEKRSVLKQYKMSFRKMNCLQKKYKFYTLLLTSDFQIDQQNTELYFSNKKKLLMPKLVKFEILLNRLLKLKSVEIISLVLHVFVFLYLKLEILTPPLLEGIKCSPNTCLRHFRRLFFKLTSIEILSLGHSICQSSSTILYETLAQVQFLTLKIFFMYNQ